LRDEPLTGARSGVWAAGEMAAGFLGRRAMDSRCFMFPHGSGKTSFDGVLHVTAVVDRRGGAVSMPMRGGPVFSADVVEVTLLVAVRGGSESVPMRLLGSRWRDVPSEIPWSVL